MMTMLHWLLTLLLQPHATDNRMTTTANPIVCSLQELDVSLADDIRSCLEKQFRVLYEQESAADPIELAKQHVADILRAMKRVQAKTTCRVNCIVATREELFDLLSGTLEKWTDEIGLPFNHVSILPHPIFEDVLCVGTVESENSIGESDYPLAGCSTPPESQDYPIIFSSWPRRRAKGWPMTHRVIICDRFCGEAVLRGSDIFVRGAIAADAGIEVGEHVAVYAHLADLNNQSMQRGLLLQNYVGKCVFLGLGTSVCSRADLFRLGNGVAVRMSINPRERVGPLHPPFHGVLSRQMMLQNLPSVLVGHALDPQKGDVILDACAAPGGKTAHLASLVRNQATIIACDKSRRKMIRAKEMFLGMGATCIKTLALDSTKCVARDECHQRTLEEVSGLYSGGTSSCQFQLKLSKVLSSALESEKDGLLDITTFPPQSFDRILLDPPCSALGLRPKLQVDLSSIKDLQGYPQYQRMFVKEAVALLKPGGTLTYSTCTINGNENEGMVRHIMDEYPCMQLRPIDADIGVYGLPGFGLSEQERSFVRRFDPSHTADTMGFFVAKFRKI